MPWKFTRINQDTLGNRRACENMARKALENGKIAIIDRCNFDTEQRRHWVEIAKQARVPCECVIFSYNKEDCVRRCEQRGNNHETIKPHMARGVVERIASQFYPPVPRGRHHDAAKCKGGEFFRRVECVSSFTMANSTAERYLSQQH